MFAQPLRETFLRKLRILFVVETLEEELQWVPPPTLAPHDLHELAQISPTIVVYISPLLGGPAVLAQEVELVRAEVRTRLSFSRRDHRAAGMLFIQGGTSSSKSSQASLKLICASW